MSDHKPPLHDQLQLLTRVVRDADVFRFVILQYNQYPLIGEVEQALRLKYPQRPLLRLRVQDEDYHSFLEKISSHRGFVLIDDFNRLLDDPAVYVGFNQRRDKVTGLPVQLLCFLPMGKEYVQGAIEKIKDWWSVRSIVLKLEREIAVEKSRSVELQEPTTGHTGYNAAEKKEEWKRLEKRIEELVQGGGDRSLLQSLYPQLLNILNELGEYKTGIEKTEHWLALAEKEEWPEEDKIEIYDQLGTFNWRLGHYEKAAVFYQRALAIAEGQQDEKRVATAQNNLANVYLNLGRYEEAAELLTGALQSAIDNFGPKHPTVAVSQSNLANVYRNLGRYEEAAELLTGALQSAIDNFGPKHPTVAVRQSNLANVYRNLGRYEEAAELLTGALQSAIDNFGPKHPTVAVSQSNLASVYSDLGRYEEAAQLLTGALQSDLDNFGPKHPNVAVRQSNLANVYSDLGRYEEAAQLLTGALQSDLDNFGPKHPNVAVRQSNLANVYRNLGRYEEAAQLLTGALQSAIDNFGPKHPNVATRFNNLAWVFREQKKWDKALSFFEKAYAVCLSAWGKKHPNSKSTLESIDYVKKQMAK